MLRSSIGSTGLCASSLNLFYYLQQAIHMEAPSPAAHNYTATNVVRATALLQSGSFGSGTGTVGV